MAENGHLFLGPFFTVNGLEVSNISLVHQEVNSDRQEKQVHLRSFI